MVGFPCYTICSRTCRLPACDRQARHNYAARASLNNRLNPDPDHKPNPPAVLWPATGRLATDALSVGAGAPPVTDAASSCTGVGACSASAAAATPDAAASSPALNVLLLGACATSATVARGTRTRREIGHSRPSSAMKLRSAFRALAAFHCYMTADEMSCRPRHRDHGRVPWSAALKQCWRKNHRAVAPPHGHTSVCYTVSLSWRSQPHSNTL